MHLFTWLYWSCDVQSSKTAFLVIRFFESHFNSSKIIFLLRSVPIPNGHIKTSCCIAYLLFDRFRLLVCTLNRFNMFSSLSEFYQVVFYAVYTPIFYFCFLHSYFHPPKQPDPTEERLLPKQNGSRMNINGSMSHNPYISSYHLPTYELSQSDT